MKSKVLSVARGMSAPARSALLLMFLAASVVFAAQAASAAVDENDIRRDLPIAVDGEVWAVEQVGNSIVVGGNFTQVQTSRNGPVVDQAAIYAYDIDTGEFNADFRPLLVRNNGLPEVRDILPTEDGTGLYIGGRFNAIDDRTDNQLRIRNRLALLEVRSGRLDRNFAQAGVDAAVLSIDRDASGRIYAGGNFLTVFDLAPNRPPIEQAVRGLARFDGTTGQFDTGFRYESRDDIGRPTEGIHAHGVSRVVFGPNRVSLFVAHRGAELYDAVNDRVMDSPGLARIDVQPNQHEARPFKVLHPDANDPIQEFYHAAQCAGRGTQIRDMDVANGYLIVVHQGADTGVQCDTAVRISIGLGEKRPDWVSRVFDSIFSVEIDGNDVYIGGHFRYMVNDTAPSPYPGAQLANGEEADQVYIATPDDDPFRIDLIEPGYVFPVNQFGLLDARTGFGDPTFNPGSNAGLGVLELTVIDRGLLLGQDNDRVADILTGRSAFFDIDPDAADPSCSVSLNGSDVPVVSWTNIGDVNEWNVRGNETFLATAPGNSTQFVHADATAGQATTYELRYNRFGSTITTECGTVTVPAPPPPTLTCSTTVRNADNQVSVSWNDEGWGRVSIRANGDFLTLVDERATVYTETGTPGSTTYSVRAFIGGQRFESECGNPVVIAAPSLTCTAAVEGDQVTLNWTDRNWNRSSVRRDGAFIADVQDALTFTETAPIGTTTYSIRAFINGERVEADCNPTVVVAPPAAPVLACTESVNNAGNLVLRWNDVGANAYQVRTNDAWTASLDEGTDQYVTANNGDTLSIRYRLAGEVFDVTCG